MPDEPEKTPDAPLRVKPADVIRTPSGVVTSYGGITEETKLDLDAATADPVSEMRRTDRLPDPASLTVGDVSDALLAIKQMAPMAPLPPIRDAILRRDAMLGASPGFASLRESCQANLGIELTADSIATVVGRLATKLRKPFADVRSIPATDAVRILVADGPKADDERRVVEPRRKRTGRPPDTDAKRDRRIADAWRTKEYENLDDLARAFGTSKPDVKRALDRDRKRRGKKSARKSGQES